MTGSRSCLGLALVLLLLAAATASAAPKHRFVFELTGVKLKGKFPAALEAEIGKQLSKQIKANPRLLAEPPEGAPDPSTDPKGFKAYMQKRRLRSFKVNVEVTDYEERIEPSPRSKRGKMVVVRIALRIFGETVPERTMAFTGDGSATIKIGTGSKVRDKDKQVANREATQLAVEDAVGTSIRKLDAGKKKKKKRR
ncbi:MAG: hypothetical protein KJO07_18880 [Deltaproteobacteria bacterium]|nr:hypothetical protein [Deltaproteobacteria bacterium]